MSKPSVRITITLPADLVAKLRETAKREHRTTSQQAERMLAALED